MTRATDRILNPRVLFAAAAASASAFAVFTSGAGAASVMWDGGPATDWNTATNWAGDIVPTSADSPVFTFASNLATSQVIDVGGDREIKGINIGTNDAISNGTVSGQYVPNFTIANTGNGGAAALTMTGGATGLNGSGAQTNAVAGSTLIQLKSNTLTGGVTGEVGTYTVASNLVINVASTATLAPNVQMGSASATLVLSGVISTASGARTGFRLDGSGGSLALSNEGNTYTGGTVVSSGSLFARGNDPANGTDTGVFGRSTNTLTLGASQTSTTNNVALYTNNGFTVARNLTVAATAASGTGGTGLASIGGAPGSNTNSTFTGTITLARPLTVRSAATGANRTDFTGKVTGAFSVNKTDVGVVRFSNNANDYSGGTTVTAGRLEAGSANALGTGAVTVAAAGTLGVATVDTAANLAQRPALASLANAGLVDVAAGGVRINAGVVESDLRTQLIAGRNGGAWNGATGITSSTAAASGGARHVGYVMNSPTSATVAYAGSGDTDLNHEVNTDDILNILSAGKLDQDVNANWQEGDFNYDNRANTDDILAILAEGNLDAGPYARTSGSTINIVGVFPGNASLLYDPANGNVKIDANGFNISGFNLQDALADSTNVFAGASAPTFPAGSFSTTDNDTKVAWATVSQPFTGLVNLGNIALPGLSASDLLLQLSGLPGQTNETYYTAQGITGRQNFNTVPEPASLGLLGLAGVGLLARRRRMA